MADSLVQRLEQIERFSGDDCSAYNDYVDIETVLEVCRAWQAEQGTFYRTRDAHADDCIQSRNEQLSKMAVRCDLLRDALVKLVGVDGKEELEQMESVMRTMPAPAEDKAATIDAIHALIATLPPVATPAATADEQA